MASLILSSYRIDIPGSRSSIPYQTRWISNSFSCRRHQHCFYPTGWQSNSLVTNHIFKYLGKIGTLRCFSPGANSKSLPPWQSSEHPRHPADNPDLDSRRRDPTLPWRPPQPSPLLAGYLQQVGWSRPTASCGIKSLQLPPAQTLLSAAVRAHFPLSCNQGGKLPK